MTQNNISSSMTRLVYQFIRGLCFIYALLLPVHLILIRLLEVSFGVSEVWYAWKDVLMVLAIIATTSVVYAHIRTWKRMTWIMQVILWAIHICVLVTNVLFSQTPLDIFLLGYRFELLWVVWLVMFLSYLTIESGHVRTNMRNTLRNGIEWGFYLQALVSSFVLLIGQDTVFQWLRFNEQSQNAQPQACHAIDAGIEACRLSGGFSHPNHYAGYLLLMVGYGLYSKKFPISILASVYLFFTASRFSLIGITGLAVVWVCMEGARFLPRFLRAVTQCTQRRVIALFAMCAACVFLIPLIFPIQSLTMLPDSIRKPSSTFFHQARFQAAIDIIIHHPQDMIFGYGMAQSGPAAKIEYYDIFSRNRIFEKHEIVAYSYGLVGEDLLIPENWFIQLLFNGGVLYMVLYCVLLCYPLMSDRLFTSELYIRIALMSLITSNLVLHLFESSQLVLYAVLMYGIVLVSHASHKSEQGIDDRIM